MLTVISLLQESHLGTCRLRSYLNLIVKNNSLPWFLEQVPGEMAPWLGMTCNFVLCTTANGSK